jgi:hypothetical protein
MANASSARIERAELERASGHRSSVHSMTQTGVFCRERFQPVPDLIPDATE